MEPASSLTSSKSDSFSRILSTRDEKYVLLPPPVHQKPKIRVRALLGHCLYRRVIIWTLGVVCLLWLAFTTSGVRLRNGRVLDFVEFMQGERGKQEEPEGITFVVTEESVGDDMFDEESYLPPWLKYKQ